jgi:hypothetical protein
MWNPISIDRYVKIHLKKNPNENEKVLMCFLQSLSYPVKFHKFGLKAFCGNITWLINL